MLSLFSAVTSVLDPDIKADVFVGLSFVLSQLCSGTGSCFSPKSKK